MKRFCCLLVFILPLLGLSCDTAPTPRDSASEEKKIEANLAKLDPADRKLAEEQRFCVIQPENRLGEMDVPRKVMIKGEPVFLCCKNCEKKALADPDKTLAKVKELRAKSTAPAETGK